LTARAARAHQARRHPHSGPPHKEEDSMTKLWPQTFRLACGLFAAAALSEAARADEGMWTYDNFPKAAVAKKYGFTADARWLEHAQRSSLRLAGGCSGSFVSGNGLVMTNHHCVRGCVSQLSTKEQDYGANGFYADAPEVETRCPEIELNELLQITDVTKKIREATKGLKAGSADYLKAQKQAKSAIEKECAGGDEKLRCDVVDLYRGGVSDLYKYRRYQDVRLVFAPEQMAAHFGGDPDNFNFPRFALDAAFVRAYDDGKPVHPEHWFKWSAAGAEENELVFVSGNPGSTRRALTVAELVNQRDVAVPERLIAMAELRGVLTQFGRQSAENDRISKVELLGIENGYKGYRGRLDTLVDPKFIAAKIAEENKLKARVTARPELQKEAGQAWDTIAKATEEFRPHRKEYEYVEMGAGFGTSRLWRAARSLVRATAELKKPDADRLREYGDAKLPAIKQALFSKAPIYDEFEILKLTHSLIKLREELGSTHPFVVKVLGKKSPEELAAELVKGSALKDVAERKRLFEGGPEAVAASKDPLIQLALSIDQDGRKLRKWKEDDVDAKIEAASEAIARARFALDGQSQYPDATFTLRLSYGAVKGWTESGHTVKPFTDFAGAFAHNTGRFPFNLPESWMVAQPRIKGETRFDLVTDNDIIGGNSGSPLVNKAGEVVGLVFDGNLPSLGGDYWFEPEVNRTVAVHSAGILEALRNIYGAKRVLDELVPAAPAGAGQK
jgi:Peptidase S46